MCRVGEELEKCKSGRRTKTSLIKFNHFVNTIVAVDSDPTLSKRLESVFMLLQNEEKTTEFA